MENKKETMNNDDTKDFVSLDSRMIWIFIGFIVVVVVGYAIGISSANAPLEEGDTHMHEEDGHDHSDDHDHDDEHDEEDVHKHSHGSHDELLNLASKGAPILDIDVFEDSEDSWTLRIDTENFVFAPENVNSAHVSGEGHAHLYIDGKKIGRVYGPWLHLGDLGEGEREIRVTLNANSHEQLAVDGQAIEKTVIIGSNDISN